MSSLSKTELKDALKRVWEELVEGNSDAEAADLLGMDEETYAKMRRSAIENKANELRSTPPEHLYVEYMLYQMEGIRDLTEVIKSTKTAKHPNVNAIVAAVKVRSDIRDKIVAKGQEFGVLKKTPDKSINVNGLMVADLTSTKLRAEITCAINDMDKLMSRYGEMSMTEVDPGKLHHGPRLLSTGEEEIVEAIEAPLAKDDIVLVPEPLHKKKDSAPRSAPTIGKKSVGEKSKANAKVRPPRTAEEKEAISKSKKVDFERWGD